MLSALFSCKNTGAVKSEKVEKTMFLEMSDDLYELVMPKESPKEVMVLFGGYPENAEDIKREFNILENAKRRGVSLVYMNYSQKIWLTENEKKSTCRKSESNIRR